LTVSDITFEMLQSGLTRLKSVFHGGEERERPRQNVRSTSLNLRQDIARQILSKKMSVPVTASSIVHNSHNPVTQSRSVPCYNYSPTCPSHNQFHRKLTRAGAGLMTPTEKQKLQQSHLKQRRERARSTSAVPMHEPQMYGVKRRKQDHNRNIYTKESDSSSDSNPEDHIYEEIDSDSFTTHDEDEVEDNFLLSISLERQRNLKFYGSAGWDFGNVS